MKVKLVSESTFTVKEHGVHTAFLQTKKMLEKQGVEVTVNSFGKADVTHVHTIGPYSLIHLIRDEKTIISAHVVPDSFVGSLVFSEYWLWASAGYLKYIYNKADLVLAVAPKVKEELEKIGVKSKIKIFSNPIDLSVFKKDENLRKKVRRKHNFGMADFIVMGVGQVQDRKGVGDFIDTAIKLPKVKFVWLGGKPFGKLTKVDGKLQQKIKKPPQNVIFLGSRSVEEMPGYYNIADVFFLPSYQENAPMSVIEAGATSLPLVLRDLDQYKLLYGDGYLPGNANFADIIQKLKVDTDYREKYSAEALKLASRFSTKILGPKLIKLYKETMKISD